MIKNIRNIAIIAHVDHGKTTLCDELFKQTGTLSSREMSDERILDANALEKERGITILAKNTAIAWNEYRINILDTPGHADFGGEVERVLSMVDGVLLLVDAVDGPMPQTRFVTQKAFAQGLHPIVVVNKIDRPGADPDQCITQVFDLFDKLGATDEQLDFPIVYASGLNGFATLDPATPSDNLEPLLETIVRYVPPPKASLDGPFQMQISALDYSSYVGAIGIGRITRGTLRRNMPLTVIGANGKQRSARALQVLTHLGLDRIECESAEAGDIVAVTGIDSLKISDTLCDPASADALPPLAVDEPTVSMMFQVNDSPFCGREGQFVTSRQIRERLDRELIHNVALRVKDTDNPDQFLVMGRGELHLGILLETMRREGYELAVAKPHVLFKDIDGVRHEPYEELVIDVESTHQGAVMEQLGNRGGELNDMITDDAGRVRLTYRIPARGLIGFHTEFMKLTSGTGVMTHVFLEYGTIKANTAVQRQNGALISMCSGKATAYSLWNLQARGQLMIDPQVEVYEGMIVGIHSRDNDLVVNVTKGKQLTNIRAAGSDENIQLTPPIRHTLEQALEFIDEDELVEITPKSIRLRKKKLKEHERKRAKRTD